MYYQLSKSEKKIAQIVMKKGLDKEYLQGLNLAGEILDYWRENKLSIKESYMQLIQGLDKIDSEIANLHNGKGGYRWAEIIAGQLAAGFINLEDIEEFRPETVQLFKFMAGIDNFESENLKED